MNATDYKISCACVNQTAHVAVRVHAYERMKLVRVTRVSDTCHMCLPLNLSPVCTIATVILLSRD